ncbi:MAG: hypothetical protein GOMPHAMPRED_003359 [Gomphillus americanus]|uniref:Uncharacterized protein n=1 Tax=Gomphillus americanus TaxID=1940652 RepID=A0A8H3EKL9_9LECA|nr:MAG: hypothetical protein GOMPHAMPRED_003359 [Gomphillus americanus]
MKLFTLMALLLVSAAAAPVVKKPVTKAGVGKDTVVTVTTVTVSNAKKEQAPKPKSKVQYLPKPMSSTDPVQREAESLLGGEIEITLE